MKIKIGLVLATFFWTLPLSAAMAPKHSAMRDLQVMVDFVSRYQKVAETLDSINFKEQQVLFSDGCIAQFERKSTSLIKLVMSMPGPGPGLEFKHSSCPLQYPRIDS